MRHIDNSLIYPAEYDAARKEILRARKVLGKRVKGDIQVKLGERLFDRRKCEPAVIRVDGAIKGGCVIKFVVISPRDQDLLMHYFRIRNNCPRPIKTSKLFVNALGTDISKNVGSYIRKMGLSAKIKGFNCQMLRSIMETENVLDESIPEREAVSSHLGHTARTRQVYYVLEDRRHCVQASNRLLAKLEEIGEIDDPQVCKNILDLKPLFNAFSCVVTLHFK